MKKKAIIVAAGAGIRMGAGLPKQFMLLNDKPVIWHTLQTFLRSYTDMEIILVLPEQFMETGNSVVQSTEDPVRIKIVAGGKTRFHSVQNGLNNIQETSVVFVHDGVRCLLTPSLIQRCYNSTIHQGNAVPAIKAVDSVRLETIEGNEVLNRDKVNLIQTPQTFLSGIIKTAFEQPYQESFTDEASVVERTGVKIHLVEGEVTNIKITKPLDLLIATQILRTCI